jgi:hypothetical protein
MAVLKDFACRDCSYLFEEMVNSDKETLFCVRCGGLALPLAVASKSYKIRGANDASITPKKHSAKE